MAEHPDGQRQKEPRSVAELTTEIVTAYVTMNTIATGDLGDLIAVVGRALEGIGRESTEAATTRPEPAVPLRRSIREDHLICLICGKQQKTLRRHLDAAHQLMPAAYREVFGLKPDYPMVAPGYSRQRSEMAKRFGLGQRAEAAPRTRQPRRAG